ncbi:MAG: DUF2846 domain-containing protein [Deltaproteobacteria bacterium]|nr:DUF2846 domain-containing protein [Deltaproteobacteria bacterium]
MISRNQFSIALQNGLTLAAMAATITGCASVPLATPTEDAFVKQARPAPGMSLLYVYRNESFGAAVKMPVLLDGQSAGSTVAKTFTAWSVAPGPHQIMSKAENDADVVVVAEPNKTHFVWQEVKMGLLFARSKLHPVTEEEGRQGVNECKLIKMATPMGPPGSSQPAVAALMAAPAFAQSNAPSSAPPPNANTPAPPAPQPAAPMLAQAYAPPPQPYANAAPPYAPAPQQYAPAAAPAPQAYPATYGPPATPPPVGPVPYASPPQAPYPSTPPPPSGPMLPQTYPPTAPVAQAYAPNEANPSSTSVVAQALPSKATGAESHNGFFLRLGLGAGYSAVAVKDVRAKVTGQTSSVQFALGGAVVENLVLHVDSQLDIMPSPSVTGEGSSAVDVKFAMLQSVGAGATWFFGPNVFATASLALSRGYRIDNEDEVHDSKGGLGLNLGIGKEWWVSDNWGLGGLLRLNTASFKDSEGISYSTAVVSLGLSMTYN